MSAREMLAVMGVAMLVMLGGCDTEPAQEEAAPAAPEQPAPDTEAAPDTSAEAATEEEDWGEYETPQPVSGSAAPSAAQPAAEAPAEEGDFDMAAAETLFKETCTNCHKLERIEHHAKEELAEEPWDEIVTRMVEENGAKISPEDQKTILTYLQTKYPE